MGAEGEEMSSKKGHVTCWERVPVTVVNRLVQIFHHPPSNAFLMSKPQRWYEKKKTYRKSLVESCGAF